MRSKCDQAVICTKSWIDTLRLGIQCNVTSFGQWCSKCGTFLCTCLHGKCGTAGGSRFLFVHQTVHTCLRWRITWLLRITLSSVQVNSIIRWNICGLLTRLYMYIYNCGEFKYEIISSRGTKTHILLLDGVDVALIAYQLYVHSASMCSVCLI